MRTTIAIAFVTAGCMSESSVGNTDPTPPPTHVEVALVPTTVNRDVDLLFVIDDSPSMLAKQDAFRAAIPALVSELTVAGELPNLHIGVVSPDLGTTAALDPAPGPGIGSGPGSCSGMGKGGSLQPSFYVDESMPRMGQFLSDIKNPDGTRATNYTGALSDAIAGNLSLGASGCGFEQHAEAARRALDNNPANPGFLRPEAGLAIIVLADEDDCSLAHHSLLGNDTATLGPLQSFRCTRFGITCDPATTANDMNQVGPKTGCRSNETGGYVMPIDSYASFFRGLKSDPRNVMMAAIIGDPSPVEVELRTPPGASTAIPALAHACSYEGASGTEVADPAVRLEELTSKFSRGMVETACTPDLSGAASRIGRQIKTMVGESCLARDIKMPADCHVLDTRSGSEIALPECGGNTFADCYSLVFDPKCSAPQYLRIEVNRSEPPAPQTMVSVRCRL